MNAYLYIMKIHIGNEIKRIVEQKGINISKFSSQLNVERSNIYNIYKRESIDTELLRKISIALEYNFFSIFCSDEDLTNLRKPYTTEPITSFVNESESVYIKDLKKQLEEKIEQIGALKFQLAQLESQIGKKKFA